MINRVRSLPPPVSCLSACAPFIPGGRTAFSRTELVVVLALTAMVSTLLGAVVTKARTLLREAGCAENLRQLGHAMSLYANQSHRKLPYAYIVYDNKRQVTWDSLLEPLVPAKAKAGDSPPTTALLKPVPSVFKCPSDALGPAQWAQRNKLQRRSYSMPRHDMRPVNWPPGSKNSTGVGLYWTFGAKGEKPPSPQIYNFKETNSQAAVTLDMVLAPAKTMLLTEQISSNNIARLGSGAFITTTLEHLAEDAVPTGHFERGQFNYLMVDGHVEPLFPEETVGPKGAAGSSYTAHFGLWTIRPDD